MKKQTIIAAAISKHLIEAMNATQIEANLGGSTYLECATIARWIVENGGIMEHSMISKTPAEIVEIAIAEELFDCGGIRVWQSQNSFRINL